MSNTGNLDASPRPGESNQHGQQRPGFERRPSVGDEKGSGLLAPQPRLVNGRPITTIRTVGGSAGTVAISGANTPNVNGPGGFTPVMPNRSLLSTPMSTSTAASSPMTSTAAAGQLEILM